MIITKYIPFIILLFFLLKYLLKFLENKILLLNSKIEILKIESGMLSINDLQEDNYKLFIDTISLYLLTHGYQDIKFFDNKSSELTNIKGKLNKENVLISCIQNKTLNKDENNDGNWQLTTEKDIQCLLARMHQNQCRKGLLINNSTFNKDSIEFVDKYNNRNTGFEIKIVDGYELARAARNYKNLIIKES